MELAFNQLNKSGQGLKMLTPIQMLSRLPISLAQLKAGNNFEKLKNEIRQLLYSLYRQTENLEKLRTGFKITIKWNIYSSEITNQTKNNKLNYLIDPTCTKVNLFYRLKIKTIEHLFQSIMYQIFK